MDVNPDAINLAFQRVTLSPDVRIWPSWEDGQRVFRIEDCLSGRFFQVGQREYTLISLLNGQTTVAAACGIAASVLGTQALTEQEAESIVVWLVEERLANFEDEPAKARRGTAANTHHQPRSLIARLNPFWMQIPLVQRKHSARLRQIITPLSRLLHRSIVLLGMVTIVFGGCVFFANGEALYRTAADLLTRDGWIAILVTWIVLKIVHELGHSAACERFGGETSEFGIILILFAPLAYVDVSGSWSMPNRWHRMAIAAAGMYVELLIAAIAMITWCYCHDPMLRYWLANVVITAGVSTIVFNANPLMRFDGYYLLSDLLQMPNLYDESSSELKRCVRRILLGESTHGAHYRGWRLAIGLSYAVAAATWRVLVCFVLCVTASYMFAGFGLILSALGLILWFSRPLASIAKQIHEALRWNRRGLFRSVCVTALVVLLLYYVLVTPVPSAVTVPVVVQDPPEWIVRAPADSFVVSILVSEGEMVDAGQPLIELENRELRLEATKLRLQLQETSLKQRIARDNHDAAAQWAEENDRGAIERQLDQLQPKLDALTVSAAHRGVVSRRNLPSMQGRFVREGDELLRVRSNRPPLIVGLIGQDHVTLARAGVGQHVEIVDPLNQRYRVKLTSIDPRASRKVTIPELTAKHGGPIGVEIANDSDSTANRLQLMRPHFTLRARIVDGDSPSPGTKSMAARRLDSGMRAQMRLGCRQASLVERLDVAARNFLYDARKTHQSQTNL